MYRGRLWTMRQIAGFGTGEDTNGRFRYLIAQGQTGLSVDFDMPTLMGYDSDDPRSLGEVGREGVAVDTLDDMEALFDGHRPRAHLRLDDDQPHGVDPARHVRGPGRVAGPRPRRALGHGPGRHPQGVHRPEGVDLPHPAVHADHARHDRLLARGTWRATTRSTSAAITSRRPGRPRSRRWPSPWPTPSPTSRR